jgi:hypothetical protein
MKEEETQTDSEVAHSILQKVISPEVFISYCWSSPEHVTWVINLAQRLVSDGVAVVLDKWDLKEGQDLYHFMETMVKSEKINRVLIILDKKYYEKANERTGGVGTETQIISPEIYKDVSQEKFIPLLREKDSLGQPYTPSYLSSRYYVDFTDEDKLEESYEQLLRNIFERPTHVKPKLGTPPQYLFEEQPNHFKTTSLLKSSETVLFKSPQRANSLLREFTSEFFLLLKEYKIEFKSNLLLEVGKQIHDTINSFTPLRNEFISFLQVYFRNDIQFDVDLLISLFEKLPSLEYDENRSTRTSVDGHQYKFINRELFLYTVALALKYQRFNFLRDLFYSKYFFKSPYRDKNEPSSFSKLDQPMNSMDIFYKQTFSKDFISTMVELIMSRIPDGFTKDDLILADYICYIVSELYPDSQEHWFVRTYYYNEDLDFEITRRLISRRHFEKVKGIFNVETPDELKTIVLAYSEKMNKQNNRFRGYSNSWSRLHGVEELFELDKIATAM